jgi:hypothetical protein
VCELESGPNAKARTNQKPETENHAGRSLERKSHSSGILNTLPTRRVPVFAMHSGYR